jgi:glycosyltransferase involved in cell wall biosynthesis
VTRVLMVSVEPPWPAQHGGRLRVARVAEALSHQLDILVTFPDHGAREPASDVPCRPLRWAPATTLRTRGSARPHLGGHYLLPVLPALLELYREFRPDAVYWSHSYLAAWSPPELGRASSVVEFANIEGRRLRTLVGTARGSQRAARRLEAAKASWWEPRVAREASLCVALSRADEQILRDWGAAVVSAPNGVDLVPYRPSPADGYALVMASYDYEPNVTAARGLVHEVWPLVRRQLPSTRLVVAGRGSESLRAEFGAVDGVHVAGTVDEVSAVYGDAAIALAPAMTGGGSQLKLTESLSRGRAVVMTPFAAAGLTPLLTSSRACRVAEPGGPFAAAMVAALRGVDERHADELDGWQRCQQLGWDDTVRPVVAAISRLTTAGSVA